MSEQAQSRLLAGTVAVLGLGSWGKYAAQYMSEVGIGCLVCVDENADSLRQVQESVRRSQASEGDTRVHAQNWKFNSHDAEALFAQVDVVIDGLDNWQHKLVASDLCNQVGKPLIHAGGFGFRYQVYTMAPPKSACLRCVFPEVGMDDVPLTPSDANTLSPVAAMVGALQSIEAIKIVAKLGATQGNELWKFDWLSGEFETVRGLDPRYDCPDCGRHLRH